MLTAAEPPTRRLSALPLERPGPLAVVLALAAAAFSVALAAESYLAGEELHEHFQNPGPVNALSTIQLLLVSAAGLLVAFTRGHQRAFWLLFAAGFAFFAIDQQWKDLTGSSEQDLHAAIGGYIRDNFWLSEPLLLQWSDALVFAYLIAGGIVIFWHRKVLLFSGQVVSQLGLALLFAALMVLTDSFVVQVPVVKVVEETFKLVAGSFFLSAVLTTWRLTARERRLLVEAELSS